jgi:hypothetical protein
MNKRSFLVSLWFAGLGSLAAATATGPTQFENDFVQVTFDPAHGTFSLGDRRDHSLVVENAAFSINGQSSDEGYTFTTKASGLSDELGRGTKITFEGSKPGRPSLLLELHLYDNSGAVALTLGLENASDEPLRIKEFQVLKGTAFRGQDFIDYKTLDGENGAAVTHVRTDAVLASENNLLVTFGAKGARKRSLVIGGLSYHEFRKQARVERGSHELAIELKGNDPVGKLVDAHGRYLLQDKFYLDFTTDHRFEALERYGAALAAANHVEIGGVNFPVLNFWYAFIPKFGADQFRNNSLGTIEEMTLIQQSGFLKYGPFAVRLEPDDYALPSNAQGWWDDAHWQRYKGGQLLAPYDTIVKWGGKIRALGGIPFIYCQTAKRSQDYCEQFPEQMLFNRADAKRSKGPIGWWGREGDATAIYWTYDFTDPGFIAHMKDVYRNLRAGGVQGIKFDYPDTGWAYDGGFEDKYATTTSAYRNIFRLAYEGLGPRRDVQERIPPFGDVALGLVTTQRTEGDNDRVYPARVAKTGLRWYKNRVVVNYDCDPVNPFHVYPADTRDGWRAALTMTTTTSGRLEIGKYFEKLTPEMREDLARVIPLLEAPSQSARPVDAFTGVPYPRVYDFRIDAGWHIVTFFNSKIEGEEWPTDVMAYWTEGKQFNPRQMVPSDIAVPLGSPTDEGGLGLDAKKQFYVFDFWNWQFVGQFAGDAVLQQVLRPGEARVMAIHEMSAQPQFLSTSRHVLQGRLDFIEPPHWNSKKSELSATSRLPAEDVYRVIIAGNGRKIKKASATGATAKIVEFDAAHQLYELQLVTKKSADIDWKIIFQK